MAHAKNHDYHILTPSIYPFLGAVGAFLMLSGVVLWISGNPSAVAVTQDGVVTCSAVGSSEIAVVHTGTPLSSTTTLGQPRCQTLVRDLDASSTR